MVNCLLHNQNFTFFLSSLLNCLSVFLSYYQTLILSLLHGNTLTYSKVILSDSQLTSFSRDFTSHNYLLTFVAIVVTVFLILAPLAFGQYEIKLSLYIITVSIPPLHTILLEHRYSFFPPSLPVLI